MEGVLAKSVLSSFFPKDTHRRDLSVSLSSCRDFFFGHRHWKRLRGPLLEYTLTPPTDWDLNVLHILAHGAATISLSLFIAGVWHISLLWWIGLFCTLIPTLCELMVFYRVLALKIQ